MSDRQLAAAFLAGRRLLKANSSLFDWSRETWETWLELRRRTRPDRAQPPVLAIATLTCLEDLYLHLGLMQVLAVPGLRCTPIFRLPTEAAAKLMKAKARREEWDALVHILSEAECAEARKRFPADTMVIEFELPVLLPPQALRIAEQPDAKGPDRISDFLKIICSQDLDAIPVLKAPELLSSGEAWLFAIAPQLNGEDQRLPELGQGDELIVTTSTAVNKSSVVVRQLADACSPNRPLRIRMPARFLTTEAQEIRVDCYKPEGEAISRGFQFHVPPSQLEPWMVAAFLNRGGGGNSVIRAFASGIGCRVGYAEDEPKTLADIPVVWGVLRGSDRILAQAKAQGLYFFYIDHAYFDRGHSRSYRITRNGYEAGPVRDCPGDRFSALGVEVQPWRKSGREILVCPPTEYFMEAHGCQDWLETTLAGLQGATDRPIVVRTKPKPGEDAVPLEQALESAHALVTHSSNVAIEAACFGTPVFVAPMSAAAPVGRANLLEIESPAYPDRRPWLSHLAYNQFSFEEIANGTAWRLLLELEQRDHV